MRRPVVLGAVLLAVSTATVWATSNTKPLFTIVTSSGSVIYEGRSVTVSGTFTDPDVGDFHSIRIHWGDAPATPAQQIDLPPGQFSFQVSHTYKDDLAPTNIVATLYDRQTPPGTNPNDNTDGFFVKDARKLPIQVMNVAPRFVPNVTVTKVAGAPGKVLVDGTVADPGTDRLTVLANFGDGQPTHQLFPPLPDGVSQCAVSAARQFHCEHQYAVPQSKLVPPKTYPIKLGVQDDDGGTGTFQTSVQIP